MKNFKLGFKIRDFKSQLKANWDSFGRKTDNLNFTNSCFYFFYKASLQNLPRTILRATHLKPA